MDDYTVLDREPEPRHLGILRISKDMLAAMIGLPAGSRIDAVSEVMYFNSDELALRIEHPALPAIMPGNSAVPLEAQCTRGEYATRIDWSSGMPGTEPEIRADNAKVAALLLEAYRRIPWDGEKDLDLTMRLRQAAHELEGGSYEDAANASRELDPPKPVEVGPLVVAPAEMNYAEACKAVEDTQGSGSTAGGWNLDVTREALARYRKSFDAPIVPPDVAAHIAELRNRPILCCADECNAPATHRAHGPSGMTAAPLCDEHAAGGEVLPGWERKRIGQDCTGDTPEAPPAPAADVPVVVESADGIRGYCVCTSCNSAIVLDAEDAGKCFLCGSGDVREVRAEDKRACFIGKNRLMRFSTPEAAPVADGGIRDSGEEVVVREEPLAPEKPEEPWVPGRRWL